MLKSSTIFYVLIALLCAFSVFLIIRVPQIYGRASLGALVITFIAFRFIKISWLRWTSLGVALSAALFFIISGMSFHFDNTQNRVAFNKHTAVNFEEGPFATHLAKAKRENKKVFLDIYTAWCTPCLQFNKTVLTDNEVAAIMNDAFNSVKLFT